MCGFLVAEIKEDLYWMTTFLTGKDFHHGF